MAKVQLDNLTADYQMPKDRQSVWITVGNISVYIKQDDEGVAVDLFSANDETSDCLTSCWATYAEAEPTCEWCEMSPCECVDEDGNDYNAAERLCDKVARHSPELALALADDLQTQRRES